MFSFSIQLIDWLKFGTPSLFVLYYAFTWIHWLIRVTPSLFYKVNTNAAPDLKNSIILPVVDEDPEIFSKVLKSIAKENPDEVIVVINGPRNEYLENICKQNNLNYEWTEQAGKRNAIDIGISLTHNPILVLVDSDTIWTGNTLKSLIREFNDAKTGGATTKQRIINNKSIIGWFADTTERLRNVFSFKSMSVFGEIGCLPGRTFAMRRSIYNDYREKFLKEKFFGVFKEYSDDRTLTNFILKAGYKTKYAYNSLVYTFSPTTWKKYYKQQLRWARGGQYNNLRMFSFYITNRIYLGYMFFVDMILPMIFISVIINFIINLSTNNINRSSVFDYSNINQLIIFSIIGALIGTGLRLLFVMEKFSDWLKIPLYLVINSLFITPIRLYGFATMLVNSNWDTRRNAYEKKESFSLITLIPFILFILIIIGLTSLFQLLF